MATLKSLRVSRPNTGKQKAGQGRYQKNRELYDGKVGDNRRFAILGRFVPRPKDHPRFKPWNSRPDAPLCVHCMETFKQNPKHIVRQARVVDHIVPINQGGEDEPDNWQPLCTECHNTKSATERWTKIKKKR